jgi:glyoxylase-like metal-dependent hydrolase (beta-lactamase superfamily II)
MKMSEKNEILAITSGPLATNSYIAVDAAARSAVVVDAPPGCANAVTEALKSRSIEEATIVITHGHWDHTADAAALVEMLKAPVLIHRSDAAGLEHPHSFGYPLPAPLAGVKASGFAEAGAELRRGSLHFRVLHIPGHTPGHIGLYESRMGVVFTGDVLFEGSVGRTDLPGGDWDTLMESIRRELLPLPAHTVVYPGHGGTTTIGREREVNPFVREYLDFFDPE